MCGEEKSAYVTIKLDSELDLSARSFPSPSDGQMLAHTHTYLHMYACTPYDCVSNKLSLLWRRSFRMRKVSVNSSTGMLTMCNISKQEIIEKIKHLTQRLFFEVLFTCMMGVWMDKQTDRYTYRIKHIDIQCYFIIFSVLIYYLYQ